MDKNDLTALADELDHLIPRYPSDQSIIDAAASALRAAAVCLPATSCGLRSGD
jgi:hypothetical protein